MLALCFSSTPYVVRLVQVHHAHLLAVQAEREGGRRRTRRRRRRKAKDAIFKSSSD